MDYQTFVQQLQKEACQPIYFFYGEEVLLRQRALKILEKQILPEGLEDFFSYHPAPLKAPHELHFHLPTPPIRLPAYFF